MKRYGFVPNRIILDKLRSHDAAKADRTTIILKLSTVESAGCIV
ncbi:hypothetical protein CES86_3822 [Brucella lupini]|uniref:Uncharacterized protein n=1 Tax=Brucella lupini TaxID=255457 RepID=A0A256GGS5_9HYPH|nr:hypothetical protein CES86_3822 [Brucella lupini]